MEPDHDHIIDLLKRCASNDRVAQKTLYREFYSYGMSICMLYADNREEAAEILNDGFMKIFTKLGRFDLSRPFKPWLRKIMINTAINNFHQKQRQVPTDNIEHAVKASGTEQILSGISYQEVVTMLQKLPPAYRSVFNLFVIEGYSHEEIAKMLGISTGTSKSNLFKAKEQLKKILAEFFETDYADAGQH